MVLRFVVCGELIGQSETKSIEHSKWVACTKELIEKSASKLSVEIGVTRLLK
jgi:hypothetical protein